MSSAKRSQSKLEPMDESKLEAMRSKRKKESLMEGNLQQILVYTFYLIVITIISYGQRDPMAYYVTKHIEDYLVRPTVIGSVRGEHQGFSNVSVLYLISEQRTLDTLWNI